MSVGTNPVRALSETAKHVKTISKSPLKSQTILDELFSHFDLTGLTNAVIPFAYDGTAWLAATQGNSTIRYGSLNNHYAPWAMMLYCLREEPSKIFDQVFESAVSEQEYKTMRNRLNMFMERVYDAQELGRRLFETDDILYCASVWYLLANTADWSNGFLHDDKGFNNPFAATSRELIDVKRHERFLYDVSQRLDGAFIHNLDPTQDVWRMIKEDNGAYIQPDTLWIIAPDPSDMEVANGIIRQIDAIASHGAAFMIVTDRNSASMVAHTLMCDREGNGKYDSSTIMIDDTDHVVFTNLAFK
jgi:hypothetical protein